MAAALDAIAILEKVLTRHGPLHEDAIPQHLRDSGIADPESARQWNLLEMDCPARQLVDDRWAWLPALLAGRLFTHRLNADEATLDVLTVTPELSAIATLCEHAQYHRLADGSTARLVLAGYDDELLDERNIPGQAIDPAAALLLEPPTLGALGVGEGDTVGVRLSTGGLVLERFDVTTQQHTAGERLAATLDADVRRPIRDSREAAGLAAQLPADDPTRHGDLIKLLDSFPAGEDVPGRMSAARLLSALGLEGE